MQAHGLLRSVEEFRAKLTREEKAAYVQTPVIARLIAQYEDARAANVLPAEELRKLHRRVVDARNKLYRQEVERLSQENQQPEGENRLRNLGDAGKLAQTIEDLRHDLD